MTSDEMYRELRRLLDAAEDVASSIRQGQGTLGQLVRDPSAYRNLAAALDNLQEVKQAVAAGEGSLGRL